MSMTDEEKLDFIKRACCDAFCEKINKKESIAEIKSFIQAITPANVKQFILYKINNKIDSNTNVISKLTTDSTDYEDLKDELNGT